VQSAIAVQFGAIALVQSAVQSGVSLETPMIALHAGFGFWIWVMEFSVMGKTPP
jgi:hypothetical protein